MQNKFEVVIEEFRKGDAAAYASLHTEFFDTVYYFTCRLVGDKDDANDIVAEVFTKLWQLRASFDTYTNIKSFLFIATRNSSFNLLESRSRKAARTRNLASLHTDNEPPLYIPEAAQEELIRAELVEYFHSEVKKLPNQMRNIFEMRVKRNLPNAKIAADLQISEVNVRNQLSQGIRRLRNKRGLKKRWMMLRTLLCY
jgi:RNA polymerase sigma-70 factor (family 1)